MQKMLHALLKRVVITRVALASSLVGGSLLLLGIMVSPSPRLPISQLLGSKQLAALQSAASGQVISANPNPIVVCDNSKLGITTLSWNPGAGVTYEVHSGSANGPLLAQGQGSSSKQLVGVAHGQQYFLVKLTTRTTYTYKKIGKKYQRVPVTTTTRTTLGSTTITITAQGCSTPPPAQGQASFVFQTTSLPTATVGTYYTAKISFQYHTTGTNYATNATFTGLPNGVTTGSASSPNTTYGILPGLEGPNGQASVTISGVPTTAGTNTVTLALTDQYGTNASSTFTLVVQSSTVNNPQPPTGQVRIGQLVKSIGGSDIGTIYVVGDQGLLSFSTAAIFDSWCFQYAQVVPATSAEMALPRVGVLSTPRQAGQTVPPGVSVLLVSTCGNQTPPPAPENRLPISTVEVASCDDNVIKGWAADQDVISNPVHVRITDGGSTVYAEKDTDQIRDDVNAYLSAQYNAGHPVTGAHGFSFDLTPLRSDEKAHLFAMELVDNTGAKVRVHMGSMFSFSCPAITVPHASLNISYSKVTFLDKYNTSVVLTDTTGRDDTSVTYREDTISVGDTLDVCPGPDGTPGRRKNIDVSGWISPNGGSIFIKDSVTNQEKWFASYYGPTPQKASWTAMLGAGNTAVTYTFRVSNYFSGANTLLTKTVTVRPIAGSCDPGEYTMTYFLDNTPFCPRNNQYTRVYATATLENVNSQPPLGTDDAIVVKFRPFGKADIPANYQIIPVEVKYAYTNDPHYFVISINAFTLQEKGTYDFFLKFRGKTIHQVSKEYFVGLPGPLCE